MPPRRETSIPEALKICTQSDFELKVTFFHETYSFSSQNTFCIKEIDSKLYHFRCFWSVFSSFVAKLGQDGAKMSQDAAKMGQDVAKMGQSGAKMIPRWRQDGPRCRKAPMRSMRLKVPFANVR